MSRACGNAEKCLGFWVSLHTIVRKGRSQIPCVAGYATQKTCVGSSERLPSAFPDQRILDILTVFVFPEVVICLACGQAQFTVPEDELRKLTELNAAAD